MATMPSHSRVRSHQYLISTENKLKIGGRLFAIIGDNTQPTMEAVLMTRVSDTEWSQESLFETNVDLLVNFDSESPSFVF